jgi:TIGR03009 family protein
MSRSRMILVPALTALIVGGSAVGFAQDPAQDRAVPAAPRTRQAAPPAQGQARPAPNPARMQQLLKAWEGQSAKLTSLDVSIYRIDKDVKWGDEIHYEGRAVFKAPNLAYLDFSRLKMKPDAKKKLVPVINPQTGKPEKTRVETVVCSDKDVWQYLYETKQILIFPLAKEQRQRALEEGPLPFLFNMRADEAAKRYQMTLLDEDEKFYVVKVIPRLKEDQDSFKTALLTLEKTYLLPSRIALLNADGKSTRDYRLTSIKPNAKVDAKWFAGVPLKGWKLVQNPAAQAPQQGNAAERPDGARGMFRK